MTTINILALEVAITSSTGLVESLDRIAVNAEVNDAQNIRDIRKKLINIRNDLYAAVDAAKDSQRS